VSNDAAKKPPEKAPHPPEKPAAVQRPAPTRETNSPAVAKYSTQVHRTQRDRDDD